MKQRNFAKYQRMLFVTSLNEEARLKTPDVPPDEASRLAELRSLNVLDTIAEERFDRLTRMVRRLFGVDVALVSLVDENRQWFKSCAGMELSETPRDISFCGHAILGDGVFVIPDALQDERFADNPPGRRPATRSVLCGLPPARPRRAQAGHAVHHRLQAPRLQR